MPWFTMVALALVGSAHAAGAAHDDDDRRAPRNVIIFVADGLRRGSVNSSDTPTLLKIRRTGVDFANSHALFPTFTTPNASGIATGHYLGDTGDFSNTVYLGFPLFNDGLITGKATGTQTPFLENNQTLADIDEHFPGGNYLNEESLLALARQSGYNTASVGKVGPVGIQDVTQLNPVGGLIPARETVFIDDATGTPGPGVPLSPTIQAALTAAGLPLIATPRVQPAGNVSTPGTLLANVGQQQYFADATTKAILPTFKANGRPFALVFWSRDPDGSQHNQGDSLNKLSPGINGPTSRAGVSNADANLKQILDYLAANPDVAANTDLLVTSDHGFATISKHEIDAEGHATHAYPTHFTYLTAANDPAAPEVIPGWLPPGFLAIDIAHALSLPLFDPDSQITVNGALQYTPVDPSQPNSATSRQRPAAGNGLVGGTGAILTMTDAKVVVAANGGSDLIYVPDHDSARVRALIAFLTKQDYVGGLFVDSRFGEIPGALPLRAVGLEGDAVTPRPAIAVTFKTFSLDRSNPLQTAVQIADSSLQEGQGMHGSLGRDNTFNNMAAIGPDFKRGFVDWAPVSNADIARTLAHVLRLKLPSIGELKGRVLREAFVGGPNTVKFEHHSVVSAEAPGSDKSTVLEYQTLRDHKYFDVACVIDVRHRDGGCD